ncbi:MAG: mechanosensitive ion channel family protein [Gammaproteobacteria bacterium]|nr:MAG: mechanosensitive ion channel family protein [Gammaproteobacteria bacterium]
MREVSMRKIAMRKVTTHKVAMRKVTLNPKLRTRLYPFLFCLWSSLGVAANEIVVPEDNISTLSSKINVAPVIVNGEVLFEVIGIRFFPAKERAKIIADRIERIAEDNSLNPNSITIREHEHLSDIMYGNTIIMAILDADTKHLGYVHRKTLAEAYVGRIREGIEAYRLERTSEKLEDNIIQGIVRTLALIVILFLMRWLFRSIDKLIEKVFKRRIESLEVKSMRMIQSEQIWRVIRTATTLLKVGLTLALVYVFLNYVLTLFPMTRYVAGRLLEIVVDPLQTMAIGIINYLPSLFFLVILFLASRYILRLLHGFFDAIDRQHMRFKNFDAEWAWPTYRIVRIVVIVFAIVIAYPYIPGSSSDAFKGISLFLGVLLSLGSTSVISNIIAGYTMTYRNAFKVGDRVRIGDTIGDVLEVRLLVTYLNSLKNEKIVIPNSTILNSEITNYSNQVNENGLILHTQVGIGYEVPWRQVEAMLIEAASRSSGLMEEPAPFVLQTALTDFAVTYELNAYCKDATKMVQFYSELHRRIQDVFNEYGVQIMTPNYIADTPDQKLVPVEQWYTPPATKS